MRVSFFWGVVLSVSAVLAPTVVLAQSATPAIPQISDPYDSSQVETAVAAYFSDAPQMIAAARCESGFRQFDENGNVLNGGSGGMLGVYQISSIHISEALSLGMDVKTLAGNLEYARYLYTESGMDPWLSSYDCWGDTPAAATVPAQAPASMATVSAPTSSTTSAVVTGSATTTANPIPSPVAIQPAADSLVAAAVMPTTKLMMLGSVSSTVKVLQTMLNRAGFAIAKSGPGSKGHETTKFGLATLKAVQKFQCAKGIVCSGSASTTGYGLVGPKTYAVLQQAENLSYNSNH